MPVQSYSSLYTDIFQKDFHLSLLDFTVPYRFAVSTWHLPTGLGRRYRDEKLVGVASQMLHEQLAIAEG
jgi:hypothetical protein